MRIKHLLFMLLALPMAFVACEETPSVDEVKNPSVAISAGEATETSIAFTITSTDADHLDIYGTEEAYLESFSKYTSLIQPGGVLILHTDLKMVPKTQDNVTTYYYSRMKGDFHAENIQIGNGRIIFDLISPIENIPGIELGVPVVINIDNGIGAMALAQIAGATANEIREAMLSFGGVDRRFDFHIRKDNMVYISDYAHHPEELRATITSLRGIFPARHMTAIFQPHLYTRTRDFAAEFSEVLSMADRVIMVPIYPARELPIEGVNSEMIGRNITTEWELVERDSVAARLRELDTDIVVSFGAGNIDVICGDIASVAMTKING